MRKLDCDGTFVHGSIGRFSQTVWIASSKLVVRLCITTTQEGIAFKDHERIAKFLLNLSPMFSYITDTQN
jgi:hypothetical protein